ncbi:hypothetical protein VE03_05693 [Pseudogymnoascus sp. 23342-1-I1]|nr:hypothetical protein VE03_05693 [Pseudogymnoascus sp. 23342-1-I1]
MTDGHVHSQHESKLLSIPVEIRQAIYTQIFHGQTHAFLWHGRIHLSECLQPNLGDDSHDGRERKSTVEWGGDDPKWARRLRSSWGVHWECEEAANPEKTDMRKHRRQHAYDLLVVCKKMFIDVCDFVKTTVIIFTDVDTLNMWLLEPNELNSGSNWAWDFQEYIRPSLRKLNVAFRLPLAFFEALEKALEEDEDFVLAGGDNTSFKSVQCNTWERLWPAVCQLPQLRSLHIWLDHDDRPSWSFVNERLALHPVIAALAARTQACSEEKIMQHLDIAVNLPKLHPRYAKPDTHFFQEGPPPPFTIERRIRQRWHCEERDSEKLYVGYKADFPVWHELPEMCKESTRMVREADMTLQEEDVMLEEEDMTLEEVEELETRLWNEGTNVHEFMSDFNGPPPDEDTIYSRRFLDQSYLAPWFL